MKFHFLLAVLCGLGLHSAQAMDEAVPRQQWSNADADQAVLVITPDWQSPNGMLQAFERKKGAWQPIGDSIAVSIGKNGSAWGLGIHPQQPPGSSKIEGDGKAPAGIFNIGTAFGYAPSINTLIPYQGMDSSDWCVDVNDSPFYNRIVTTKEVGFDAVKDSTEPMRRDIHLNGDMVYKKGFVIAHNPSNIPKGGSCIFAHLWRAPGVATAGCTAMPEAAMDGLLAWLDVDKNPIFILLPQSEYNQLHATWQLPELSP
jgi:L,D-peptidoglycan transpeptidase YkuD (ErfK/YbiS/YcfS/YnhG family)